MIEDIVNLFNLTNAEKALEDCKPIDNSNFAFSIIALVIQTVLLVIACAMFVCTAIAWMVNMTYYKDGCYKGSLFGYEFGEKVYWAYIVCFVLCIVCAATSVIVTLPCCDKALFVYIHMICCTVHVVFCWISQLGRSCRGYGYVYFDVNNEPDKARDYRFISYTLVEFIMITVIYLCSVVVFFKVSFKL